ncbi:Crp/Fnr family transcriptional regulator [Achromobacter sp. NPDC058515]|uniref:Crp/Fnr family transcriptional regulator n=1 Tax=Achromobacter sp. NPDC058515 TaxID=3346533 RepID=UPI0036674788
MDFIHNPIDTSLLRNVPLFRQVHQQHLDALAKSVKKIYANRKVRLFRQGDRCEGFHAIVYGRIKMSLLSWHGADRPIQIMGPGECFGDITMFNGESYFMNVDAIEDSLFLYVPRDAIAALLKSDSDFAMAMLGSLSQRVRGIVGDIEAYALQPPAARLVSYLIRLLPPNSLRTAKIELSVNKNIIAARLNLSPETLSRYFKELTALGLVTVNGRLVVVHDIDKLENYLAARPATARQ